MTRPISSKSLFRPAAPVDQSILAEHKTLLAQIDRRSLLRGTISLGALSLLTGCNVTDRSAVQSVLTAVSSWNDLVQAFLFRPNHLVPTYSEAQVVKPPRFNAYYEIEQVKPVDAGSWKPSLPASSRTSGRGPRRRYPRCRSRSSSSVTSASKGGTISAMVRR